MKKILLVLTAIVALTATSCTSNEKKAYKLIKQHMYESLYDYKSYEPTKTTVEV